MKFLVALLWVVLSASAATVTVKQNGNADDTNTYVGLVLPTAADTLNIPGDRLFNVPSNYTLRIFQLACPSTDNTNGVATVTNRGAIIQGASGFMAFGSGANRDGRLVLGPNSTITVSNNLYIRNAYFLSEALPYPNEAIIDGPGAIGNNLTAPRQVINLSNVCFFNAASVVFGLQDGLGMTPGASSLFISNCVFTNSGFTFGATNAIATTPRILYGSDFVVSGSGRTLNWIGTNGNPSAQFIKHCTARCAVMTADGRWVK